MKKVLLQFFIISFSIPILSAQTLKEGITFIKEGNYHQAAEILDQLVATEPENAEMLYFNGIAHLLLHENEKGLSFIEKAVAIDPDIDKEEQDYWKGMAYNYNLQFEKAVKAYNDFLSSLEEDDKRVLEVNKLLKEIENARKHLSSKTKIHVEPLKGNINTEFAEHSPVLTQSGITLFYTSSRPETTGGGKSKFGTFYEDIFYSEMIMPHTWSEPMHIAGEINSEHHDAVIQLFDQDRKMLIYRPNRGGDFYISEDLGGFTWSVPYPMKQINSIHSESHAFISEDGLTIYFSSNRDAKDGNFDLYYAEMRENGKWDTPIRLGDEVNTEFDEDTPFLSEDGQTLYFSSTGHNSMGGFDIFKSEWNGSSWGSPEHLGVPINSTSDDFFYSYHPEEEIGYFSSNRKGGKGRTDLYQARKTYEVFLGGLVTVGEKAFPAKNLKMIFSEVEFPNQFAANSDNRGDYRAEVESNSFYKVLFLKGAEDNPVEIFSDTVFVLPSVESGKSQKKNFHIPLSAYRKAPDHYTLSGKVTDPEGGQPYQGEVIVQSAKTGEIIGNGIVNENGKYSLEFDAVFGEKVGVGIRNSAKQTYESLYVIEVGKDADLQQAILVPLDAISSTEVSKENLLSRTSQKGESTESSFENSPYPPNAVGVFYFKFDSDELSPAEKARITSIISRLTNAEGIIQITGHTDSTGDATYNLDLSRRRARSVRDILIGAGLNADRIRVQGKGEDAPLNDNSTSEGRSKNRRVVLEIK